MYSKEIEEVIDAALLVGAMTDRIREMLTDEAEKEGEDADEVIMVAEMRLKQNPNGIMPKVDKKAFENYVMSAEEEKYAYEFLRHKVYKADKSTVKHLERLIAEYNEKARFWDFDQIEWSSAMKEKMVFYAKFEELEEFDPEGINEPIKSLEDIIADGDVITPDILEKQYRKGVMEGRYDSIIALAEPYNP